VPPQLIARDLFQSFRMGSRRIEVLRGISIEVAPGEIIFIWAREKQRCFIR